MRNLEGEWYSPAFSQTVLGVKPFRALSLGLKGHSHSLSHYPVLGNPFLLTGTDFGC